ncbi:MAG: hypothetical protein FGM40_06395 [Rhodocyclaceae bacterium]|nr:hypothetical protein [Rhodocyclaceae bacterium]
MITLTRKRITTLLLAFSLGLGATGSSLADDIDPAVAEVQHRWEVIQYQTAAKDKRAGFEALAEQASGLAMAKPERPDALIWEGIVLSSLAGEKQGLDKLSALGLIKRARERYETAIRIDPSALNGSAFNSLAVLFAKAPGWPLSFGDKAKAEENFLAALQRNPNGIDTNYFYGEFLLDQGKAARAIEHLEKALNAPPRPGRQIADEGRRREVAALLEKAKAKIK